MRQPRATLSLSLLLLVVPRGRSMRSALLLSAGGAVRRRRPEASLPRRSPSLLAVLALLVALAVALLVGLRRVALVQVVLLLCLLRDVGAEERVPLLRPLAAPLRWGRAPLGRRRPLR